MLMGFPAIPFLLCDFCLIFEETSTGEVLRVRGALPGGDVAVAQFRRQTGPKGSWRAFSLVAEGGATA
ncbi:MAG: hypothetical protein IH614_17120 [Desulfuromonadales bacterium]|nr:hypothetical protein [Desulfuromonadales bacterium]